MVYPTRRASDHRRVATVVAMRHSPEALRAWCWMAFGMLSIISSFGLYMLDPLDHILTWQTTLKPGTVAYKFWAEPLDMLYVRVYLFNITNPEAFLSGAEKMNVQEVGPFVYREMTSFKNLSINGDKASFRAHRHLEFVEESSIGDPKTFKMVVPNLPLLGAAAMLGESALVTNLALRSIALFTGARTLITLTAEEFLWGYDDPLISMAHSVAPSFVDFRRLGLLDRMYSSDDDVVVSIGVNDGVDPAAEVATGVYAVETFNGDTGFSQWGHGVQPRKDPHTGDALPAEMPCDTVKGSYEGILFPRKVVPGQRMYIYRKQFCRAVPITYTSEGVTSDGFRFFLYHIYTRGLINTDDSENLCYCASSAGINGACLPSGFSSISPCYYKLPLALSQPHFMNTDPETALQVTGMKPDLELHDSFFKLQPEMGIPLAITCRLQINLMMGHTRLALTERFNHKALPLMWIDMNLDLPDEVKTLMRLGLHIGPAAQATTLVALAVAGVGMIVRAWVLRKRLATRRRGNTIQHHITALQ